MCRGRSPIRFSSNSGCSSWEDQQLYEADISPNRRAKKAKKAKGGFKTLPIVTTGELVLEIKMLLDMPMQPPGGDDKHYRITAYSDCNGLPDRELGCTGELVGNPENSVKAVGWDLEHTVHIRLGADGVLRLPNTSRIIHLKVEYAGAFPHNKVIGRCRISQDDPRINAFFRYKLRRADGSSARCGIELQAIDGGRPLISGLNADVDLPVASDLPLDSNFQQDLYPSRRVSPPQLQFPAATRGQQHSFHIMEPGQPEQSETMSNMTPGPVGPPVSFAGQLPGQEMNVYSERSDALTVSGNMDITQASTPSVSYVGGKWSAVINFFTWTCGTSVMAEDEIVVSVTC